MIRRLFFRNRPTWREGFLGVARQAEIALAGIPGASREARTAPDSALRPRVSPVRRKSLAANRADA